jgi:hypothetical protein
MSEVLRVLRVLRVRKVRKVRKVLALDPVVAPIAILDYP